MNKAFWPEIGGVETLCRQYSEISKSIFDNVKVLTIGSSRGFGRKSFSHRGIQVEAFDYQFTIMKNRVSIGFLIKLFMCCFKNVVIHSHDPFPLSTFVFAIKMPKVLIITYHADIVRQRRMKPFVDRLRRLVLTKALYVTTTSNSMIRYSDILSLLPKKKIRCIPPFLNDYTKYEKPVSIEELESQDIQSLNLSNSVFLILGRHAYYKGLSTLVKALKCNSGRSLEQTNHIVIAGAVADDEALSQLNELKNYSHQISIIERAVTEKEKIYLLQNCEVFLFLSNQPSEAFGITQLEAAAAKLPIVNFDLKTGVVEVGANGITAHTLKLDDYISVANMLGTPTRQTYFDFYRPAIVDQFLKDNFSEQTSCRSLHNIYNDAARTAL
ncbi:glycosyltransferase [bacterium]|nr:glycosyltransferase [bacterium]